jgi:predicted ATPase/class 3 adenylate cyclase
MTTAHNLVPRFILEQYAQGERDPEGSQSSHLAATTLFSDISGFSTITDTLMQHGQHGAEVLADIMCAVFEPLVHSVYQQGGFVANFAGDAFTAVFPGPDAGLRAAAAAWQGAQHMADCARHSTPYGDFRLSGKMGLAAGQVSWGIVTSADDSRASYYFRGSAIDGCAAAEKLASTGEIILDAALCDLLAGSVTVEAVADHYRLTTLSAPLPPPQPTEQPPADLELMARFFPRELVTQPHSGEFRQVVNLFIHLPTVRTETQLAIFMRSLFALQDRYGGLLNRLDFGDKGAHLLLFWGAPVAYENDIERVLDLVLGLQTQTAVPINAGVTYRIAHAGFTGSSLREEFTCNGRGVNLAARFMTTAPRGEIWLDEPVARRAEPCFELDFEGQMDFKGFAEEQKVYVLLERREEVEAFYQGDMVGRKEELAQLAAFIAPMWQGQYTGALVVWGEAGIGKSRLVHEFGASTLPETGEALWALCQSDQVVRQPFNPLRYWLRRYFGQSAGLSESRNKRSFNRHLDRLIAATEDKDLAGELDRTRSFLGALVGLHWPDSLYGQLDGQGRYQNTLIGLATLLQAESLRQPLVLHLEDAHWLDEETKSFLVRLAHTVTAREDRSYPIAIIATARPVGTGHSPRPAPPEKPVTENALPLLGEGLTYQEIDLGGLSHAEVARLAETLLLEPAAPALLDLLVARAEGNPFFAEQILLYLREQGLIELRDGAWHLAGTQPAAALPTDVRVVLVARLDRLAQEVKEVVQTAAVLGREFEMQLLSRMLRGDEAMMDKVATAEQEAIWSALSQLRYLFKHALLRDAAYRMQLRVRRRELHHLAAETMESLYQDSLTDHYGELAYHCEAAYLLGLVDLREQAIAYLRRAGEQAKDSYEHAAAVDYFSRALALIPADAAPDSAEAEERYALLLGREEVYALQGEREAQAGDLEALEALAQARQRPGELAEVVLRWARYASNTSDYPQAIEHAQAAIAAAQAAGDKGQEATGQLVWSSTLTRQGEYAAASGQADQALALAVAAGRLDLEAESLQELGTNVYRQGDYARARGYFERALAIARQMGHRKTECGSLMFLGGIAGYQGDIAQARGYFEGTLAIDREIGDRWSEGWSLYNLGLADLVQGDYARAQGYFRRFLAITCEIGNRRGEASALNCLGEVARHLGDSARARDYYGQSLAITREIGDRRGESLVLSDLGLIASSKGDHAGARDFSEQSLAIACETGNREGEGDALTLRGDASVGLGSPAEAIDFLQQAIALRCELGNQARVMESRATLGRAHLAQGDPSTSSGQALLQALAQVEEILAYIAEGGRFEGAEQPLRNFLTCYRVLQAAGDPRAAGVLQVGYEALQKQAARIPDEPTRRSFLENVPWHREILEKMEGGTE